MPELQKEPCEQQGEFAQQAAQYKAFASFFLELPTASSIETYRTLAKECGDITPGLGELVRFFEDNSGLTSEELVTKVGIDRTFLLRGTTKKGPKPPYGSLYSGAAEAGRGAESGASMLALKAAYREAGLELSSNVHEAPDYIGVELAFMALLFERAEAACGRGDAKAVEATMKEGKRFFQTYLSPLANGYTEEALSFARTGFCRGIMMLLQEFIKIEGEFLQDPIS